jgi:HK97 family phage prohead protease
MTQFHTIKHSDGREKTVATFSDPSLMVYAGEQEEHAGTFEAVVSTFGTRVKGLFYDQMLKPGCFSRTLAENGFPACVWSHDWDTPPIGATLEVKENAEGLLARARLFVADGEESPLARQVYTAMQAKGGDGRPVLREFSIGFEIVEAEWEVHDEEEVLAISDVNLIEFGPCLKGRNVSRLIEVNGASAPDDPVLARFPRRQEKCAEFRALQLAQPRRI